jgi:putative ABC transport system permease protein
MLKNYLKTAFRSLLKNRIYSIINISGSAIGIASFILVILYVSYELSYDMFFADSGNIYRVYTEHKKGDHFEPGDAETYNLSGPTLKNEFTGIIDFVRLFRLNKSSFEYNHKIVEVLDGHLADPSYFNVFKYPLVSGNPATALNDPNTIILSQKTADKIFGKTNPVGKSLIVYYERRKTTLTVTGILKNIPENTHLKANFLVSFQTYKNWEVTSPQELNWNCNNYFTYIRVDKNTDIAGLRKKITQLDFPNKNHSRHNIEPLTGIHLYSDKPYEAEANGSAVRVKFLFVIAVIILLLSWLNYMNLTTAKSMERLKEVGIRKVSGARKMQLILQFISESVLLNVGAILIALGLVVTVLPYFNIFTGNHLVWGLSWGKSFFLLIGIPILGIVISGLYPAFVLSGFKPVKILKGKVSQSSRDASFRKGFVVVQFLITIVLLIGTLTVMKQTKFLTGQSLGVNLDKIISIKGELIDEKENYGNAFKILKGEIQKLPFVESVATAGTYPGDGYDGINTQMGITYPDGTQDDRTVWYNYGADEDYIPLMKMELVAGQQFTKNSETNRNKVILNEKAAKQMGFHNFEEAVGQKIKIFGGDRLIVGIMKDYSHFGLKNEIEPLIITYSGISDDILVKLDSNVASVAGINTAIKQLKEKWQQVFPKSAFQYNFVDEKFALLYEEERMFGKAFALFTFLAIFIASLGLFGLAFYRCLLRTKEIGVRKVNGARVTEILTLLNQDFMKWIAIAFILACPIAWYVMHKWLQNFANKTELSWWIFVASGGIAVTIAMLTVSWQSWRAATRNPVKSLRYE